MEITDFMKRAESAAESGIIGGYDYQAFAEMASEGCPYNPGFMALGITEEAGEVAGKVKKAYRDHDGVFDPATQEAIAYELGDVLFYLTNMATLMGYSIEDIARMNMEKITSRLKRGVLHGEGDYR